LKRKGCIWGCFGAFAVLIILTIVFWNTVSVVVRIVEPMVTPMQTRTVSGDSSDRLMAIQTALELYHQSEGHYPDVDGWMEEVERRIRSADLPDEEAKLLLIRPGVENGYGFALNEAFAGQYFEDVPNHETTVLVFESSSTNRDAAGAPETAGLPGGIGVTSSGSVKELRQ
jgi:hypothetical protein